MRITRLSSTLGCLLTLCSINNVAAQSTPDENSDYSLSRFSMSAAIGTLAGESNEYVYNEIGEKISQLNWKINQATIIKGELNYDLLPWLTANAQGWITLTKGSGTMDDYDWLIPNQSTWSHWSHHENTDLSFANDLDLNLRSWVLQKDSYKLGITTGYEQTTFSFLAQGGCFQYYNGAYVGCISSNEPVIGYKQVFNTVYAGITGKYFIRRFELDTTLKFSPWVESSDVDQHYLRNLTFKENGNHSCFYSANIIASYYFTKNATVFIEGLYNRFTNGDADTEIRDNNLGMYGYYPNSAGLSNKNYSVSVGIHYSPTWG